MSTIDTVRETQTLENYDPLAKQKAAAKLSRIPVKVEQAPLLKKPEWIRVKAGSPSTRFYEIKQILRQTGKGTGWVWILRRKPTRFGWRF